MVLIESQTEDNLEGWCIDVKYSQSTNQLTIQYSKSDNNWAGIFQMNKNGAIYIQSTTQLNIPNLITTGPPAPMLNNDTTCDTVASFSKFYLATSCKVFD